MKIVGALILVFALALTAAARFGGKAIFLGYYARRAGAKAEGK